MRSDLAVVGLRVVGLEVVAAVVVGLEVVAAVDVVALEVVAAVVVGLEVVAATVVVSLEVAVAVVLGALEMVDVTVEEEGAMSLVGLAKLVVIGNLADVRSLLAVVRDGI